MSRIRYISDMRMSLLVPDGPVIVASVLEHRLLLLAVMQGATRSGQPLDGNLSAANSR